MNFDWTDAENSVKKKIAELRDTSTRDDFLNLEEAGLNELRALTLKLLGALARIGYLSLGVGPAGKNEATSLTAAQEELATMSGSLFLAAESSARLFGGLIAGWGSDALKQEVLDPVQQGLAIGAVAVSEPGGPEPVPGWLTTARAEKDHYILTGRKGVVTNGPIADWLAVAAAVDGRPAIFIVSPDQAGVNVGPRLKTLGHHGLAVSSLDLVGVKVPAARVIGPFADDEPLNFLNLTQDLILVAASLGLIKRTHQAANAHSRSYHRGTKPIYAHQEVRFKLADTFTLYQTSQLLAYRAAWNYGWGNKEAQVLINCAKVFAAEAAEKVAGLAMQIMAGQGYLAGNVVEQSYREAKLAAIAGTTSEVSRMNLADEMLRRFPG